MTIDHAYRSYKEDDKVAQKPYIVYTSDLENEIDYTLPITNGGTGASSAVNARNNLDVYSKSQVDDKFSNVYTKAQTDAKIADAISKDGTFNITASFSSVKDGSNYHSLRPLPLDNSYSSVTAEIVSQVGASTSVLSNNDITVRILSSNTIDIYTSVEAAAGKAFIFAITLQ